MVKLAGARPLIVQTSADDGFKMSAKQLQKAINARTKALMFNSPCNPTGAVYSQGEIEELADVVRQTGIYVISDEIYEKIIFDAVKHFSMGSIKPIRDQVITVNGVSKAFSMTGWRIGYLGASEEIVRLAAKVQKQTTSGANSIAQRAAVAALNGPQEEVDAMRAELQRRRDFVDEEFSKIPGLEFMKPRGAIYCFPSVRAFVGKRVSGTLMKSGEDICRFLLEEEHVAILPGALLGDKDRARITFAVAWKDLQKGMERLKVGFKKLAEAP
jgi:aspartate aminotransferase